MGDRLAELEQRLASLEVETKELGGQSQQGITGASLVEYQKVMLERLLAIRSALQEGGDAAFVAKERDALKEENAKLRKDIERLNYRVSHLVKHVE